MSRTPALAVATLSLAVVVGAAWSSLSPDAAPPAAAEDAAALAPSGTTAPTSIQWQPGLQLRYALDTAVWTGAEGQLAEQPDVSLLADAVVTVAALDGDLVVGTLALQGARVTPTEALDAGPLAQPSAVVWSRGGAVQAVACATGLTADACRTVRSVAATLQVTHGPGAAWSAFESDPTGQYRAHYERDDGHLSRDKVAYETLASADGVEPAADAPETRAWGTADLTLHPCGLVATVNAANFLRIDSESMPTMAAEEHTRIELIGVSLVAPPPPPETGDFGPMARAYLPDGADLALDQDLVGDLTLDAALARLEELAGDESQAARQVRLQIVQRLAAMLRLDPGLAADVGARIAQGGDDALVQSLVHALGQAGTAEALVELVDLFEDPRLADVALASAALSPHMDAPTLAALEDLASGDSQEGRTAARALGAAANTADAESDVWLDMAQSDDPEARRAGIDAIGNAGDTRGLDVVLDGLDDAVVADAAAYALRYMPGEQVDGTILALLTDDDPRVASSAAETLEWRDTAGMTEALEALLDSDRLEESVAQKVADAL